MHCASLGEQYTEARDTHGNREVLFHPLETSVAVLPGESTAFPHIDGLSEELTSGTWFTLLCPNTHFACVQDCTLADRRKPVGRSAGYRHAAGLDHRARNFQPGSHDAGGDTGEMMCAHG